MLWLFRSLGRNRVYAAAAVFSIALAVGANAAIFSIVNALWLRPLPVADPDRLVVPYRPVVHSDDGEVLDFFTASSLPRLRELAAFSSVSYELHTRGLMALWEPMVRLRESDRVVPTAVVSHEYFATLGVAVRGRGFVQEDERPSSEVAGIVSDRFWRHVLKSSPTAVGSRLDTTVVPVRIVGIAPGHFSGARLGQERELWITIAGLPHFSDLGGSPDVRRFMPVTIYGRLSPGVSVDVATAQMRGVVDRRTTLQSLRELSYPLRSTGDLARQSSVVRVLWAAAGLVLLLGCANLAALFVARNESRRHEQAVRRCLGATPRVLITHALIEAGVLSALGLAGGLLIRLVLLEAIGELQVPAGVAVASIDARLDWRVLVFGASVSMLATGIAMAGVVSTLRRPDLSRLVSASATTGTRGVARLRQTLLGTHVALCTALLGSGVALAWNVRDAMRAELGYESESLLYVSLRPRLSLYDRGGEERSNRRLASDVAAVLESVRALPHVRAAAQGGQLFGTLGQIAGKDQVIADDGTARAAAVMTRVGSQYLTAIGARFVSGRDLVESDLARAVDPLEVIKRKAEAASTGVTYQPPATRPLAVIDTSLAQALWPAGTAIGQTLLRSATGVRYQVAGIVESIRYNTTQVAGGSLFELQAPTLDVLRPHYFVVRTDGPADAHSAAVTTAFRRTFPDALHLSVRDAPSLIGEERARERMGATVFSWFGLAAAILGLTGTYGLVAFFVLRQRRELGIRLALGAAPLQIVALVAGRAVIPSALGVCGGVVLAFWISHGLSAIIAGVSTAGYLPSVVSGAALLLATTITALVAARGIRNLRAADLLQSG